MSEHNHEQGKLAITKDTNGKSYIEIENAQGDAIAQAVLTAEDFAHAITGKHTNADIRVYRNASATIDKTKLPKLTPPEIKKWVESVEAFHPIGFLYRLPENATLEQIEDAFESERSTLTGIGETLMERAKWDAWGSYQDRVIYDEK